MVSTRAPSRAARESATTMRYDGLFFLPTRERRIFSKGHLRKRISGNERIRLLGQAQARRDSWSATRSHHLHDLLGLAILLQQTVDVGWGSAAAAGDAAAAAAVDDVGGTALLYRHRIDDGLPPGQGNFVEGL